MALSAQLKIKHKIATTLILGYLAAVYFMVISLDQIKTSLVETRKQELITATTYTASLATTLYQASIQNYLRGISETQLSAVQYFYEQFQQGLLTESEAKQAVEGLFLNQQIGSTGYNTAVDISQGYNDITLAIHPVAKGKKISDLSSAQRMYEQKQGYLEFEWLADGTAKPEQISQYMTYFEPWGWIINAAPFKKELFQLIDVHELQSYLAAAQKNKVDSSYVTIFDSSGYAIYHPVLSDQNIIELRDTETGEPFLRNLINQAIDSDNPNYSDWVEFSYTRRGEPTGPSSDKLIYYQYLPEFGWFVASIINKDDTQISYDILFKKLSALGLLALLIVAFFSIYASRYITKRLSPLSLAANRFVQGEYGLQIARSKQDEIGDLEEAFSDSALKITELIRKQADINASLESTVKARTQELEEKNTELEVLYVTDSLTNLYNRRKIDDALIAEAARAKRYHEPLSLIMLDIDHFKQINDLYGHLNGDKALVTISDILLKQSRTSDVCGRWGGEEFVIICPSTSLEDVGVVAEKLRKAIETTAIPEVGNITASFGLAQLGDDFDIEQFIQNADDAMYAAKKQGRNCVVAMSLPEAE